MDPITIGLLIGGVGALANLGYSAYAKGEADEINRELQDQLKRARDQYIQDYKGSAAEFDRILETEGAKLQQRLASADDATKRDFSQLIERVRKESTLPDFDMTPFSPREYKLLATFQPSIAKRVEEQAPQLVQEVGLEKEKRLQQEALDKYRQLSTEGDDAISRAAREQAQYQASTRTKAARDQILRDMAQRGMGGSGQELLASLASSQQAEEGARQASLQAAAEQQQRRMQALGQMTGLAGQLRQEGRSVEAANAATINAFNERLARNKQSYENYLAQQQNEAQLRNQENAQRVADANIGLSNQATLGDRQRRDQIAAQLQSARQGNLGRLTDLQEKQINMASQSAREQARLPAETAFRRGQNALDTQRQIGNVQFGGMKDDAGMRAQAATQGLDYGAKQFGTITGALGDAAKTYASGSLGSKKPGSDVLTEEELAQLNKDKPWA